MRIRLFDFLNAYPYQCALQAAGIPYELYDSPREVWAAWQADPGDAALLPLAAVAALPGQLSHWGIASLGAVGSVLLLSERHPKFWEAVHVDERSMSSVGILRHLMDKGFFPSLPLYTDGERSLSTARLVIGDTALRTMGRYPYQIDLGALAYSAFCRGTVYAIWWMRDQASAPLARIWYQYLPKAKSRIFEAAKRYDFPPETVRQYWRLLRYRLPPLGRHYWRGVFSALLHK